MIKKKLVCLLIGHAIDPCDDYAENCFRCGLTFPFDAPPRSDLGFWLSVYNSWPRRLYLRIRSRHVGSPGDHPF